MQKLKTSEEQFKTIFKLIPNPIFIYKKVEDDLTLIDYNKAAEDMTEGKIENIIGVKAKDFHKEDPEILDDLNRCINDKVKISRELKYRFKTTGKGKILNVIYNFVPPDMILVYTEDISDKRKTEEDLKKSESEKSIIFENIHEHIVFQDINHRIIWCNKAACESVNSSLEKLIGRTCFEIWQNQDVVCENCPLEIALKTGKQERGEAITPEGRVWDIRANPVRDNEGNIVGAVELTTEITEQKRAEQKLKESEKKYRNLISNISEVIFESYLSGPPIYASPQIVNITGYTPEELYKIDGFKLIHPDDFQKVSNAIQEAIKSKNIASVEYRLRHKKGHYVHVHSRGRISNIEGTYKITAVMSDITERKLAEQKLKESEEKFRVLFNTSTNGIAYHKIVNDFNGTPIDYLITDVNPQYERILPLKKEDVINKKATEAYQVESAPYIDIYSHVADTQESTSFETYFPPVDKYFKISVISPKKGEFITVFDDISEREKAEEKLKESEERYRNIFEKSSNAIVLLDFTGKIIDCNSATEVIFGYSKDELIGQNYLQLPFYSESMINVLKERFQAITREVDLKPQELQIKRKDGNLARILTKISYIKIGEQNFFQALIQDITEQKNAEEKLKKSEEKFSKAFQSSPDVMAITRMADGQLIEVNDAFINTLGYNRDELIGSAMLELNLWANPEQREAIIKEVRENKRINAIEIQVNSKFGDQLTMLFSAEMINLNNEDFLISMASDITKRKKAEQELKEKNIELSVLNKIIALGNESSSLHEFLEKSFDHVLDIMGFEKGGIYLYDPETQHNVLVLHKNVHPDFIAAVKDVDISEGLFRKVFAKNKPFFIEDFSEFMEGSKELGVYSVVIAPLCSKDKYVGSLNVGSSVHQILSKNELELFVAIGKQMGIVVQKFESEKLLKESEKKYREAYNRSNLYKDIFTHDINNILQNVLSSIGLSKLYSEDPSKKEEFDEVTNIINEQIIRGKILVSNVQKLSQIEETKIPKFSIKALNILKKAIEYIKESIQFKIINIEMESYQNEYFVIANEFLINIFKNILFNSIKHNINPIIEILIRISKLTKEGTNFIKFEFLDNGIGIPDPMKKTIFSREYKRIEKDKIPSGIGLGLLLVNRILESYNGEIEVEDRIQGDYSKGSNFIILIPEVV